MSVAHPEVQTWVDAGLAYCASAVKPECKVTKATEPQAYWGVFHNLLWGVNSARIEFEHHLSDCVPSAELVTAKLGSLDFCAVDEGNAAQITSPPGITPTEGGVTIKTPGVSAGSEHNYAPVALGVAADRTLTETVTTGETGVCPGRLQLRALLTRNFYPEPGTASATALRFEPLLYFDSEEPWRPLSIEPFLNERWNTVLPNGEQVRRGNEICGRLAPYGCAPTYFGSLDWPSGAEDFLDIHGKGAPNNYTSPNPECTENGLWDCNSGPASAIYYHTVADSTSKYTYYDYWFFYRFNSWSYSPAKGGIDNHEGDWEGFTVAPSLTNPETFDYAFFSQHGNFYSYSRDVLSCDGELPSGSCGTGAVPYGQRVNVFPTVGGHTNYPTMCAKLCKQDNGPSFLGEPLLPEAHHDGGQPWGNNYVNEALIKMPPVEHLRWVDFPGRWGNEKDVINNEVVEVLTGPVRPPLSPGCQYPHFADPDDGGGNENGCPTTSGAPYKGAITASVGHHASPKAVASSVSHRGLGPRDCASWFASDVAILVCDANRLNSAITNGTFGTTPEGSISAAGHVSGGGVGVDQAVGAPVQPGETVDIRLPRAGAPTIAMRWTDASGNEETYVTTITAPNGQLAHVVVPLSGAPLLTLSP